MDTAYIYDCFQLITSFFYVPIYLSMSHYLSSSQIRTVTGFSVNFTNWLAGALFCWGCLWCRIGIWVRTIQLYQTPASTFPAVINYVLGAQLAKVLMIPAVIKEIITQIIHQLLDLWLKINCIWHLSANMVHNVFCRPQLY